MNRTKVALAAIAAASLFAACTSTRSDDPAVPTASPPGATSTIQPQTATPSTATPSTGKPGLQPVDPKRLAIGDNKYSSSAKVGSLMSCVTSFPSNAPGAQVEGSWFNGDGTWDRTKKLAVLGQNYHPEATFSVTVEGSTRVITTNDLPQPSIGYTGNFPISPSDPAYQIDRNPGTPRASLRTYRIPANPTVADKPTCTSLGAIGIVNDGVVLFNALDAGGRDAGAHEVLDSCGGHPARTEYHHHDLATCLKDDKDASGHSKLMGYAVDGFGLFGKYGEGGVELTNAGLDECHGHAHEIDWDGKRVALYHYHATAEFPYTVGCFRGQPAK